MRSFRKVVWQAVCLGLVAFVTPPVQAFMPDGPKMPAGISVQATQAVHRAVSTVALKGRQQAAAARPDLAVRWDEHHGIPSTVSGLDLMGGSQGRGVGVTGAAIASGAAGEVQLKQQAVSVMGKLGGLYGIQDAGQEFAPHSVATSESGYRHVRLNQAYKGLPVFGGQVIVHFDGKGTARTVNGAYQPIGNLDVVATLTGEQAVDAAMADQKAMGKFPGTVTAGPELVIFAYGGVEPSLAYQVTVSYKNGTDMGRWRYWINAATGAILLRYNDIPSISAPSSGGSATITGSILTQEGGGTATIAGWREVTTNFFLWSFANTWYVYNVAINDYAYRGTNDWGTSDRMEMSAANNLQAVEDYYRVRHGRNSINDAGLMARANVHNTGQQNAFWNGSSIELYDELPCALDVMGHELTHGVDQYSADLIYADESGALNESMSDIFGTCVEFYYQPDGRASYPNSIPGHSDWLMGEDTAPEVGVIRDMKNPKAKGQPSKYKGINWDFNNEVHQNDSVQNFFFYLLCDGGSGTNEDIIYYLPGIGIRAAEKVAYLALTSYMIPSTDYTMARDYWLAAAQETDAAGATTNAAFFVNVAWAAVGIGTFNFVSPEGRYGAGGPVGTGPYLPASKVYTLRNPDTKDLTWSVFGTGTPWLDISSSTVTAAVGDVGLVTLSINQAAATNLAPGVYRDVVTFTNRITLLTTTRQVILHIAKNYTMTSVDYDWIDPVAGAHDYVGPSVSVNTPFPLPFQIGFYDDIYSALYISPHGLMGFLPDGLGSSLNEDLLTDVAPFGMLCPLWDAIEGNQYPAMMYYKVLGDAPHRKLVVTWDAAFHSADPTAQFSVQAIIEEAAGNSNNDIIFQYKDVAEGNDTYGSGQSATIGIEDEYGALCNKYSYNGEKWLANHMALKFTQNPQPDIQPPVGTIQSLGGSDQSAVFEIKFNESVTGLDTNDLVVTSNIPGIALGGIRGGGMRFLVSVTNIIGLGQVSMSVRGNAVADWAGNSNAPFGTAIYVVQPLGLDFADDMENGPAVWTASTQVFDKISTKSWEWVNPVTVGGPAANSGDHCWGAILDGNPSLNAWVMSAPISVRTRPVLNFWVWYVGYGQGYVEVNGGAGWINVTPGGVFTDPATGWQWQNEVIPLDDNQFGNRSIQVRFRTLDSGMFVDDVQVSSRRDPGVWVVNYTPGGGAPASTVPVTFTAYNSTTNTYTNVVGAVGSPESGVTFSSDLPVSYGTLTPGLLANGATTKGVILGSAGNFLNPDIQLTHVSKSGLMVLGQQALPFVVSSVLASAAATNTLTVQSVQSGVGVTDWLGRYLHGDGGITSCLYQVIYAGTNRVADPPMPNGQVTGDDRLLYSSGYGLPWGSFGEGGVPSNAGQFRKFFDHGFPSNSLVYVRAFDASSFDMSVAYGDSSLYALNGQVAQTHDFGGWVVGTPLNPGRDSNGDSITDGYCLLHGMDPRAPIVKLASGWTTSQQLGSAGSGVGQFASGTPSPTRVFYKGNFIFALDTGHNKIQVWNRFTSQYVGSYGSTGNGNGQFSRPYGLGFDPRSGMNRFAVADQGNYRIQVFQFDPNTGTNITYESQFGSSDDFFSPSDVAIAPDGRFYITDLLDWYAVQVYSSSGLYQSTLATWGTNSVSVQNPWGVTVGTNGMVVVADTENHRIHAWNASGTHLWSAGSLGTNAGQLKLPRDVAFGPGNMIFVTDTGNSRLAVYRTDGTHIATLGAHGYSFDVQMAQPYSLAPVVDSNIVYVTDTLNSRILTVTPIFDTDGDGMDDVWEILHGLDPNNPNDGLILNGSGYFNIGSYRLQQDPGLAPLTLRIKAFSVSPALLVWEEVVTGGIYRVEYSLDHVNLATNSWQSGPTVTSGVAGVMAWTNTLSMTNAVEYFRVIKLNP